jgi:hypothetical protein
MKTTHMATLAERSEQYVYNITVNGEDTSGSIRTPCSRACPDVPAVRRRHPRVPLYQPI